MTLKTGRHPFFYAIDVPNGVPAFEALGQLIEQRGVPPKGRRVISREYEGVGRCIYCGRTTPDPDARFTDEHLIPASIGGGLILPLASCRRCQRNINGVETYCLLNNFRFVRGHNNAWGRSKNTGTAPVVVMRNVDDRSTYQHLELPLDQHPGAMVLSTYEDVPQIERGAVATDTPTQAVLLFAQRDFSVRVAAIGGAVQIGGTHPITFGRLIAKICHSFATAELGITGFVPLLDKFILGTDHRAPAYWIGSSKDSRDGDPEWLHTIELDLKSFSGHVVVHLRLFASMDGAPTYRVVVGRLPEIERAARLSS